jgi:threonine dehydrogenase-like Zn-dependent dehydrogenase
MQAVQITAKERAEVVEVPVPDVRAGELFVKILAIVTCNQYDLHIYEARPMLDPTKPVEYPQPVGFPGHEWVGEVLAVGPGVQGFREGDWVCVPGGRVSGGGRNEPGGYAQYRVVDAASAIRVPNNVPPLKVAAVEMASCVAANVMDLKTMTTIEGKRCGVSGLGPAGLIAAQMLRAEGAAEVIGVEVSPERGRYALEHGLIDRLVNPLDESGKLLPFRRGYGDPNAAIQITIDCAGAKAAVQYMMDHTSDYVSLFAVQREPYSYEGWATGHHSGLKVCGHTGRHPGTGIYAVRRIKAGCLDLEVTVTHRMTFADFDEAMHLIKTQQALKVAFFPFGLPK